MKNWYDINYERCIRDEKEETEEKETELNQGRGYQGSHYGFNIESRASCTSLYRDKRMIISRNCGQFEVERVEYPQFSYLRTYLVILL